MAKPGISWKRVDDGGRRLEIVAERFGGEWRFYRRERRYDEWQKFDDPPLDDWLELLDALERRVERRQFKPEEVVRVRQIIRERFPGQKV